MTVQQTIELLPKDILNSEVIFTNNLFLIQPNNGEDDANLNTITNDYKISGVSARDIKIVSSKYIGRMTTEEDFIKYRTQFDTTYGDWDDYGHGGGGASVPIDSLIANEIVDVKLTVTNNNVLAWSGKFKCYKEDDESWHGYGAGATGPNGENIEHQCPIGIKYELTFSY